MCFITFSQHMLLNNNCYSVNKLVFLWLKINIPPTNCPHRSAVWATGSECTGWQKGCGPHSWDTEARNAPGTPEKLGPGNQDVGPGANRVFLLWFLREGPLPWETVMPDFSAPGFLLQHCGNPAKAASPPSEDHPPRTI